MTGAVTHVVRAIGPLSVVALLAALGLPAVVTVAGVAVLVLAAVCWVLGSNERSDRMTRIILGIRGNERCLDRAEPPGSAYGMPELTSNSPGTVTTKATPRGRRRLNRRAAGAARGGGQPARPTESPLLEGRS